MIKRLITVVLFSALAAIQAAGQAQPNRFPPINLVAGDPTGTACAANSLVQSSTSGILYTCQGGTYHMPGGQTVPSSAVSWPPECNAPGMVYNSASHTCTAVDPAHMSWPASCSTGTYVPASNTCVATGTAANPAGATTQVQFNGGGTFATDSAITIDNATHTLGSQNVSASTNTVLYAKAPPYNAKCDGTTDDRAAIQAAFDAAYTGGQSIQFPAGTCKTSTIVWKGQSFFGSGPNLTIIKGMPGQDVFQTPDNNSTILQYAYVHDLRVQVDDSVDASATVAGGNNTFPNRIAGTLQGTTPFTVPIAPGPVQMPGATSSSNCGFSGVAGTTITANCGITNNLTLIQSTRVIGAPIFIVGAGAAGADYTGTITAIGSFVGSTQTMTVSPATSTGVTNAVGTMLNPITPPWYLGNAAFALQCSVGGGATCAQNATGWKFENLWIIPTSNGARLAYNHTTAFFTQLALYDNQFNNLNIAYTYGEFIEAAPPSGTIATADVMTMNRLNIAGTVLPLVTYNGNDRNFTRVNIYASGGVQGMCPFFLVHNQTSNFNTSWNIDGIYCEAGLSSGEVSRFMSGPYKIIGSDFITGALSQAYTQFMGTGSTWDGLIGGTMTVTGNGNKFLNTRLLSASINDQGISNKFESATISGSNSFQGRLVNPSPRPYQSAVGELTGDWMLSGNSAAPYLNAKDLMTHCDDWTIAQVAVVSFGTCVSDNTGTEITRRYFHSLGATTTFDLLDSLGAAATWSGQGGARIFGYNVPQAKVIVYVMARCVGTASCTAVGTVKDATLNSNLTTSGTLTFSSNWTIQSWASDLSATVAGHILAYRFTWTNAGTNYDIAYIAMEPIPQDFTTKGVASLTTAAIAAGQCGTTVTVSAPNVAASDTVRYSYAAVVTANPGVLIVNAWPTAGNVNFNFCNPTAASVTPSSAVLNWAVQK